MKLLIDEPIMIYGLRKNKASTGLCSDYRVQPRKLHSNKHSFLRYNSSRINLLLPRQELLQYLFVLWTFITFVIYIVGLSCVHLKPPLSDLGEIQYEFGKIMQAVESNRLGSR